VGSNFQVSQVVFVKVFAVPGSLVSKSLSMTLVGSIEGTQDGVWIRCYKISVVVYE
jgi:hypothetical protein